MMAYAVIFCITKGEDKQRIRAKMSELRGNGFLKLFADSFFALLCPIIVLGGIYSGIVTPTEAACVSVFYALFVSLVVYRPISFEGPDLLPGQLCQDLRRPGLSCWLSPPLSAACCP